MNHRYFYQYRPFSYGCQPDGFVAHDSDIPKRMWESSHGPLYSFGWVEYPQPLTIEQVWKYDLEPDNPVEWAGYMFWLWSNRDIEDAAFMIGDYVAAFRNCAGSIPDYMMDAVRILAEAE